jgi:hypothetical protein
MAFGLTWRSGKISARLAMTSPINFHISQEQRAPKSTNLRGNLI